MTDGPVSEDPKVPASFRRPADAGRPKPEMRGGLRVIPGGIGNPDVVEVNETVFRQVGASNSMPFNSVLFSETLACIWVPPGEEDAPSKRISAGHAAVAAFKPKDEVEAMLAAQATAMHFGAMECFRRAMLPDQPSDVASKLRKDGANLARGMAEMLEVLERKRGKGPQVVRVERVIVHEGGQALVGNVQAGRAPADVDAVRRPAALAQEPPARDLSGLRGPEKVPVMRPQGEVRNQTSGKEPHG